MLYSIFEQRLYANVICRYKIFHQEKHHMKIGNFVFFNNVPNTTYPKLKTSLPENTR